MRSALKPLSAAAAATLLLAVPADAQTAAQQQTNEGLFGDNRAKGDKRKFSVHGRVSFDLRSLINADLAGGSGHSRTVARPEARVELSYRPKKNVEVFASVEAGTDIIRDGGRWKSTENLELRELYVLVDHSIARQVEFQLGRQDFDDKREWLYDERLDAVRFAYDHKKWRIEAAYGREELLRKDLFHRNRGRRKVDNFLVHAQYELTPDWDVSAYVLKQKDRRASNVSPTFFGFQSVGAITPRLGHWLEYSIQRGEAGSRKLRASAVDAGLIYRFGGKLKPAIFAGYARGSGGGNARTDHNFRQTGLQDNEDRLTGLGNVRYYGELLDPDLSNLKIMTLGAGIRPTAATSFEIVGHRYRQAKRDDDDIRGSPIDVELNGRSASIGTELDAILAARLARGLGLEAKLGWFRPGAGFDANADDDAFFAKIRIVRRF